MISVLVLAAVLFFYRELFYIGFDENAARISGVSVRNINFLFTILTALTVSIASRTVGTLIVSSMLVVPVACGMQMAAFDELLWKLEDQGTVDTAKDTDTEEQGA